MKCRRTRIRSTCPSPLSCSGRRIVEARVVQRNRVRPSRSQSSRKPRVYSWSLGPRLRTRGRAKKAARKGRTNAAAATATSAPTCDRRGTAGVGGASLTTSARRLHEHGRVVVADPALQDLLALHAGRFRVQAAVVLGGPDVLAVLDVVDQVADQVELRDGGDVLDHQ